MPCPDRRGDRPDAGHAHGDHRERALRYAGGRARAGQTDRARSGALLVVKPGWDYGVALLDTLLLRLERHGYGPAAWGAWGGPAVRDRGLARAHLGSHYLHARWAAELLPQVLRDGVRAPWPHALRIGIPALTTWWRSSSTERVAAAVWVGRRDDERIVNGHLPGVLASYLGARDTTLVLAVAGGPGCTSCRRMRSAFLGATDPAQTAAGSVRHDVLDGRVPMSRPGGLHDREQRLPPLRRPARGVS